MRRAWILAAALLAGCDDGKTYRPGDVYDVGFGELYKDPDLWKKAVELAKIDSSPHGAALHDAGLMMFVRQGEVKIREEVEGGAVVEVVSGPNKGEVGWMTAYWLPPRNVKRGK